MLVTVIVMVATGILIVSVVIFQVSYFIFNNLYAMKGLLKKTLIF